VLQEYVRESKGRDIRAIVVGGRVVASMRRVAKPGEFRSNLHRGGRGGRIELPATSRRVAIQATRAMGLEVAGVDMLESKSGPKILEINSSPGLEGIERASGVDVAGAIVDFAARYAGMHGGKLHRTLEKRINGVVLDERRAARPLPLARVLASTAARTARKTAS
jgi:ribosomal protein S6--L-glutamate ligase